MCVLQSLLLTCALLLFSSLATAEEMSERDSLPPEKTTIIYETLAPTHQANNGQSELKGEAPPQQPAASDAKMTAERTAEILRQHDIALQGQTGHWQFLYEDMQVFLLIDAEHNRLRLLTPLARLDVLREESDFREAELLRELLKANYSATGDARLCLNKNIIWAAFLHPSDTLTESDLLSALNQLVEVAKRARGE